MNEINLIFYKAALHVAAENDDIEIVKFLLANNKTDVNIADIFYHYLLSFPFSEGKFPVLVFIGM